MGRVVARGERALVRRRLEVIPVAEVGPGQVVYGTDVPFNWPVTVDLVLKASFLSDTEKEMILSTNLITLLKIEM